MPASEGRQIVEEKFARGGDACRTLGLVVFTLPTYQHTSAWWGMRAFEGAPHCRMTWGGKGVMTGLGGRF